MTDRQLGTLAFHDRLVVVGVGMPAVALQQSTRVSAPSVPLRPLPDHVARAARAPLAAPTTQFGTASALSPSTGVAKQCPREGGGTEKQTSSGAVPTGRGMPSAVPGGSSVVPPRGGKGCRTLVRVDPRRGGKGCRIARSRQNERWRSGLSTHCETCRAW